MVVDRVTARTGPERVCEAGAVRFLGIDLAWSDRARTGLAVLDESGRLVASTSVVTDDDVVGWVEDHTRAGGGVSSGGGGTPPGGTFDGVVAAIDAPLVVPNATGRRICEALVSAEFGPYDAGAHPANRSRALFDPPRGQVLCERLGWDVDPAVRPGDGRSVAIEVYPHPATITLFGLSRVIPYKAKPGRDLESLRAAHGVLLDLLERECGPLLRLPESRRWAELRAVVGGARRKADLRRIEDEVDAILCAYLAWLWGQGDERMRVLGDVTTGYIVVPGVPTAPPYRRLGSAAVDGSSALRRPGRARRGWPSAMGQDRA